MVYIGQTLAAPTRLSEPALINPRLKVNLRNPDLRGETMSYWPAYSDISPRARGAYLRWLADGRADRSAYIGYVFLFFYGLERRTLVDIPQDPDLKQELPFIRAEVSRLLEIYGDNNSFHGYGSRLLDILDLQLSKDDATSPPPPIATSNQWNLPMSLVVKLGSLCADGKPVPADWALAWAWYHPEIRLRTSAYRCTDEFATLFKTRYTNAYQGGVTLRQVKKRVELDYYAASAGIGRVSLQADVPDVFNQAAAVRKLAALAETAMSDLDAYSRFLGRNENGRGTLTAAALLPPELTSEPEGKLAELRDWALAQADTDAPITGTDLFLRWPPKSPDRMSKPETVALAQLLERFGLGIEPDVRLGGPAIKSQTPVVVFRTGEAPPSSATPSYAAAATLLHLAAAVSAADGHVSEEEHRYLVKHLEDSLDLSMAERTRLDAHLRWLTVNGVKLTGLTKRVSALDAGTRTAMGSLLVAVAAADGVISPEEVATLTKIYKLVGLDPADVHSHLHAHLTGAGRRPAPATAPVTVREAGEPDVGYPITPLPDGLTLDDLSGKVGAEPLPSDTEPGIVLDMESIEAKLAETAAVSALLADIFDDDEHVSSRRIPADGDTHDVPDDDPHEVDPPQSTRQGNEDTRPAAASIAGLDAAHSGFLRDLADRTSWSRAEIGELAAAWNLMPDGAVDRVNEAALDITDEPFLEEDADSFAVNEYAREELFA